MFSSFASYLLGTSAQNGELASEAVTADVRLRAIEGDDDWVLVEKAEDRGSIIEEAAETLSSLQLAISTISHPFPTACCTITDATVLHPLTRASSTSSLPCLSFEESWFLTPPPCFTSEGPIHMETSPLENLLIEHPSMSVYQHSSHHSLPLPFHSRHRSSSAGADSTSSNSSASSTSLNNESQVVAPRAGDANRQLDVRPSPRQRSVVYTLQQQQEKQCIQLRSAQKMRQRRACQLLKRNVLERSNKAREINSRNKCQRRSDHMQHHSGANNNRKC